MHLFSFLLLLLIFFKIDKKETFEVTGSGWYEHGFGGEPSDVYVPFLLSPYISFPYHHFFFGKNFMF